MKEKYENPEMEVIIFEESNVIATSGEIFDPDNGVEP